VIYYYIGDIKVPKSLRSFPLQLWGQFLLLFGHFLPFGLLLCVPSPRVSPEGVDLKVIPQLKPQGNEFNSWLCPRAFGEGATEWAIGEGSLAEFALNGWPTKALARPSPSCSDRTWPTSPAFPRILLGTLWPALEMLLPQVRILVGFRVEL